MCDIKRKVKFVLQYFYPEVASTAQLMTELAEDLASKGFRVKVITGQPTYIKSKRLTGREVYKGVEIERLSCTRFNKNSPIGRILNWLSFTMLAFSRLLFSSDRSPLFIVSTPPFLFVVGYLLNCLRDQRYICLIYDLYPEIAEKLGYIKNNSLIYKFWDRCNKEFFKKASFVVVPSENMKKIIEEKLGGSSNAKVVIIYNWADGEFIRPLDKEKNWFSEKYGLIDKLVILYAGNIGLFHQLETLIDAAFRLKRNKKIKFVFIGEGGKKKKLIDMANEQRLDNVLFLPYQNKDILPYSLTCSDISVVSLEKNLNCVAAPCKLYTSLAAGQIILGLVDDDSDVYKIVDKYKTGFCMAQDDVERLVEILNLLCENSKLVNTLKSNSRRCFEENFKKEKAVDRYLEIFSVTSEKYH